MVVTIAVDNIDIYDDNHERYCVKYFQILFVFCRSITSFWRGWRWERNVRRNEKTDTFVRRNRKRYVRNYCGPAYVSPAPRRGSRFLLDILASSLSPHPRCTAADQSLYVWDYTSLRNFVWVLISPLPVSRTRSSRRTFVQNVSSRARFRRREPRGAFARKQRFLPLCPVVIYPTMTDVRSPSSMNAPIFPFNKLMPQCHSIFRLLAATKRSSMLAQIALAEDAMQYFLSSLVAPRLRRRPVVFSKIDAIWKTAMIGQMIGAAIKDWATLCVVKICETQNPRM